MISSPKNNSLPREVQQALTSLRRRIYLFLGIEGISIALIVLVALFWIGLFFDRALEPSVLVRGGMLLVGASAIIAAGYWFLWRRLSVPVSNRSLALLLERHDHRLGDAVATVASLAEEQENPRQANFVRQIQDAAVGAVKQIQTKELLNSRPLLQASALASVLVGSVALFGYLAQETFGFYLERLALSAERWPRQVRLDVLSFEPDNFGNRNAMVARYDDFEVNVRADITGEYLAPERVQIHFRLPDGRRGRDYLTRIGDAVPGRDKFQTYRYVFKNVREELTFEIRGGDDRIDDLHLRVVDRPEVTGLSLACAYPQYLRREPQVLAASRGQRIPTGTHLAIRVEASKPLSKICAQGMDGQLSLEKTLDSKEMDCQFEYGSLNSDQTILIELQDEYGIRSREPYRLSLSSIRDDVPDLDVRLQGVGSAITPSAKIPLTGEITDDYGVDSIWCEITLEQVMLDSHPLSNATQPQTLVVVESTIDARDSLRDTEGQRVILQEGQSLTISLVASDLWDLSDDLHLGRSQEFTLDVVSPSDLLLLLERRELAYRQQFEAIYEKLTDTRNLLTRIDFREQLATEVSEAERVAALRKLRVVGARQNVIQAADEVLSVAHGFDNLHDQLVNNRIEDDELRERLKNQIAKPLFRIAEESLPELDTKLQLVAGQLIDLTAAEALRDESLKQTDTILVEMQYVLERMLELETYNEVVALLRGIITDQDGMNVRTKKRHKKSLRSLLEE